MTNYNAPHDVRDENKLASMIEALRNNKTLPAIVVNGENAMCGSHRIAAVAAAYSLWEQGADGWDATDEPELDAIDLDNDDYLAACDAIDAEPGNIWDYNEFCEAIYNTTDDDEIKAALADQR